MKQFPSTHLRVWLKYCLLSCKGSTYEQQVVVVREPHESHMPRLNYLMKRVKLVVDAPGNRGYYSFILNNFSLLN